MFELQGKYGKASVYATKIEKSAIDQINTMLDMPFTKDANVAIMPDAHAGAGCVIGTTMKIIDKVVPNLVGVDIGCGMLTANLGNKDINLSNFDEACHEIPSGFNVWSGRRERFNLEELRCYRHLKDTKRIERSLGSLGQGNHFIEVEKASDGSNLLIIHSGSRNLGKQVAEYYQSLAIALHSGKEELFDAREKLIREYKEQGRRSEIQEALKEMNRKWKNRHPDYPSDLCWLYGKYMDDYIHDVDVCQKFAERNRERMMIELLNLTGLDASDVFHTIHNYIDVDEMILRKGSISARNGELVLIPLNMRDGSVIAKGKGNPNWNYSAPHGAGRVMSRREARDTLSMDTYKNQMEGIYTTSVCEETIDEAPDAYKSIDDIIKPISESVDIIDVMKPIYNFKATN